LRELRNVCGAKGILPASYTLSSQPLEVAPEPFAKGGYGDVHMGTFGGSKVCIKRVGAYTNDSPETVMKARNCPFHSPHYSSQSQAFCKEAITWKRLNHPNIVPLLGIHTSPRLQLVSDWMSGGDLSDYIKNHSDPDRFGLVSVSLVVSVLH
jgi:serine/threonine protein kinase